MATNYTSAFTGSQIDAVIEKLNDKPLAVRHGGTGLDELTLDGFLVGNGTGNVKLLTAQQVLELIKALPLNGGTLTGNLGLEGNLVLKNNTSFLVKNTDGNAVSVIILDGNNTLVIGRDTAGNIPVLIQGKTAELKSNSGEVILSPAGTAYKFLAKNLGGSVGPAFYCSTKNYGTLGHSDFLWNKVFAVNGVATSSDARLKENVSDDFSKLAEVFMKLHPVTFEYKEIKDGKTRIGFIAQELEKAFMDAGLNPDDFALLQKDEIDPQSETAKLIGDTVVYSLNYAEFSPWAMAMVQMQKEEIDNLKASQDKQSETINQLKRTVEKLVERVGGETKVEV